MNTDILKGKWKQMRGEVKKWWGDLTDDPIGSMASGTSMNRASARALTGYTREKAEAELDRRFSGSTNVIRDRR